MKYFVPDIRVADEVGDWFLVEKPIITERLGGRPWGLSQDRWPKCRQCGKSQSLLAQFSHDDQRLNLGRTGRVLFVFQCAHKPGLCDSWEAFSGANACFVAEPEDLTNAETDLPADSPPLDKAVLIAGPARRFSARASCRQFSLGRRSVEYRRGYLRECERRHPSRQRAVLDTER